MEAPFPGKFAEAHGPLCPGVALAWAAHVPCRGEGPSTPNSPAESATVFCGLGGEATSGVRLREASGRGECLNDLPHSWKEEDTALDGVPRPSTPWPFLSRAVHPPLDL